MSLVESARKVAMHSRSWERIKKPDGAKRYVTKYCTKLEQKSVPSGFSLVGRFWGCSRDVPASDMEPTAATEEQLRAILDSKGVDQAKWEFLPKHIWFNSVHSDV